MRISKQVRKNLMNAMRCVLLGFCVVSIAWSFFHKVYIGDILEYVKAVAFEWDGIRVESLTESVSVETGLSLISVYELLTDEDETVYILASFHRNLFFPYYRLQYLTEIATEDYYIIEMGYDYFFNHEYTVYQDRILKGESNIDFPFTCFIVTSCFWGYRWSALTSKKRKGKENSVESA